MLAADEAYFAAHGEPLFSSHMLDLSEEPLEENIEICTEYLQRMAKIDMLLEMELGITGGEEDGVNNEDCDPADLYSKPEEIWDLAMEVPTLLEIPEVMRRHQIQSTPCLEATVHWYCRLDRPPGTVPGDCSLRGCHHH